jgi:hypothetical protein
MEQLTQNGGRAARGPGEHAFYVALVEKSLADTERRSADAKAQTKKKVTAKPTVKASAKSSSAYPGSDAYLESEQNKTSTELGQKYRENGAYRLAATSKDTIIDASIDDYVNAPTRGISCRRYVCNIAYCNRERSQCQTLSFACASLNAVNFLASDRFIKCDKTTTTGCGRCRLMAPEICCDLCTPDAFEHLRVAPPSETVSQTKKYGIRPYDRDTREKALSADLHMFRCLTAKCIFSRSQYQRCGPSLFMLNEVMDRIIDLAHYLRLISTTAFSRDMRADWNPKYISQYAQEILHYVNKHIPQPSEALVEQTPPAAELSGQIALEDLPRIGTAVTCGGCKKTGHRRALTILIYIESNTDTALIGNDRRCELFAEWQAEQKADREKKRKVASVAVDEHGASPVSNRADYESTEIAHSHPVDASNPMDLAQAPGVSKRPRLSLKRPRQVSPSLDVSQSFNILSPHDIYTTMQRPTANLPTTSIAVPPAVNPSTFYS